MAEVAFSYETPITVREDLPAAYRQAWQIIGAPGNWFSAQERLAIAAESRAAKDCRFCAERKAALSPNAVQGEHDAVSDLPKPLVDLIHRIVTDAARLTESYVAELAEHGISDGHYVEALGIVVAMISIDEFHRALDIPLEALPSAGSNEPPSGYRPPGAKMHGAWLPSVKPEDLTEPEADLYGGAPATGNVIMAMSLVPDSVRLLSILGGSQYLQPAQVANPESNGGRALDRPQIELVAARVSSFNDCFY